YAVEFAGGATAVVRVPGRVDAPAFDLESAAEDRALRPSGDVYPLAEEALEAPFAHRLAGPPRYPVALEGGLRGAEPLHRLSLTNLARAGEARHFTEDDAHLLDSGDQRTVWHRVYAEARIPPGTGFLVWCAATAEPGPPPVDQADAWVPHAF